MTLSNIEKMINQLLSTKYNVPGVSITLKDINLVKQAILVTAGRRYWDLQLNESLISGLSTRIIKISQQVTAARIAYIELDNNNLISSEKSLPHLLALDELLKNKEITDPQDITAVMIAEHIVENPDA